ncbi:MAG TPA: hypothetical protein P5052_02865 [Candidatus Paceibacterota bacterium]|nr:hypothetical protein [Candidatus Paceibacterota bacterium]HRZ29674.1 hypothetical protein [Candidatus Paceibacterota bacterium]
MYRCDSSTGNCSTSSKLSGQTYTDKEKCNQECDLEMTVSEGTTFNPSTNFNLQFNQ